MTITGVSSRIFESLVAQALVRAGGVLAAAGRSAKTVTVNATLVDVDAIVVGPDRVSDRTDAVVTALSVLAGLVLAALVDSLTALVHVDAVLPGHGIQSVSRSAEHPGRASKNRHVF